MQNAMETQDLLLRHTNKEDLNEFSSLVTLPAFGRLSPFGAMTPSKAKEVLHQIIENYQKDNYGFWCVIDKKSGQYAGFVGFQPVILDDSVEEMFYIGFNRKFWGSLVPLQAAKAVCQYAFDQKKISRFIAFIHPEDVESIYIAQNLGSQFEKECLFFDATVLLFSIAVCD